MRVLLLVDVQAGHGDDLDAQAFFTQFGGSSGGKRDFGAGGDEDEVGFFGRFEDVAAFGDGFARRLTAFLFGQVLSAERKDGRRGLVERAAPGDKGFLLVAGAPDVQVGDEAQRGDLFDGLVGGAVFAEADGVVGEDVGDRQFHQRREADAVSHVVGEDEEGAAVGAQPAVEGEAVHDGCHREFAHAVVEVVAGEVAGQDGFGGGFAPGEVGAGEVGRAADEFGHKRREQVDGVFGGFAGGDGATGFVVLGKGAFDDAVKAVGQFAAHDARVFLRFHRVFVLVFLPDALPFVLQFGAFFAQAGDLVGIRRQFEVACGQAERLFGQCDFFFAERRAVGFFGALQVG